jgi:hypothetical protein
MTNRYINIDIFLEDMERLYKKAGWDEHEVHFSLLDLKSNLDGLPCIEINSTRFHTRVKTIPLPAKKD